MENDSYKDLLQAMRNFTIGCCDFDHHKTDFSSVIADAKNTKDKKIDESNTFHTYYKLARLKYNLVSEYNQARFNNTCCVIHGSTKFTPETNEEILNQLTNKLIGYYNEIPNPYESSIYKKIYIDIDSNKFIKSIKEAAGIFNNYCDNYIDIDQINSTFTDRIKINYNQKKHDEEESQRI